jgi:hypothetical protein
MNREAEKSVIYGTWATRFVEGKKAKIGLRLNCTTRQTNPKQCNALAAKVPESNANPASEGETSVALEAKP